MIKCDKNEQLQKITDEYLTAFLGFSINKLGNITEAEELSQEIAFQCIVAINRGSINKNFNSYVWSIAHNTYKRWCGKRKTLSLDNIFDTFSNIMSDNIPVSEQFIKNEERSSIRLALSHLANDYRKTIVYFYYDELSIREIGLKLSISEGMVKFYLRAGRQKLKEVFDMNQIGEKSFNPSEFTIYKSGIDFSKVNVWEVFKRKLPCQIAIICHDTAKTISNLSIEIGTPAVYIEDEINLLLDAGVMINPVKDKYQTNFHILKKDIAAKIKEQFTQLYQVYYQYVLEKYEKNLSNLKDCDIFKFDADNNQLAWFFAQNILNFDYDDCSLSADDYPQILSCGSKSVVFAEEFGGLPWSRGQTPTFLEKCTVYPCDFVIFGEYHRQKELYDKHKSQALYDIYCGNIKEEDNEIYAELIQQGYVIKRNEKLFCNVAVSTDKSRKLFDEINMELSSELKKLCGNIRENISKIVKSSIPKQLRPYTKAFTETWISFYAGVYFYETLYNNELIVVPQDDDLTPVACWIYEI